MSFKACFRNIFEILVLFHPLVLSSCLQVLWDLEIFDCYLEGILDKDDINVLEMDFIGLTLVSLDFVSLQDVEDIFVLHKNHVFFVDVVRVLIVNKIFGSLEILWLEYAVIFQIFSSKRRWKKNNHAHKLKYSDPTFGFFIE